VRLGVRNKPQDTKKVEKNLKNLLLFLPKCGSIIVSLGNTHCEIGQAPKLKKGGEVGWGSDGEPVVLPMKGLTPKG